MKTLQKFLNGEYRSRLSTAEGRQEENKRLYDKMLLDLEAECGMLTHPKREEVMDATYEYCGDAKNGEDEEVREQAKGDAFFIRAYYKIAKKVKKNKKYLNNFVRAKVQEALEDLQTDLGGMVKFPKPVAMVWLDWQKCSVFYRPEVVNYLNKLKGPDNIFDALKDKENA